MTEIFWNQILNPSRGGNAWRLTGPDVREWTVIEIFEEVHGTEEKSTEIRDRQDKLSVPYFILNHKPCNIWSLANFV